MPGACPGRVLAAGSTYCKRFSCCLMEGDDISLASALPRPAQPRRRRRCELRCRTTTIPGKHAVHFRLRHNKRGRRELTKRGTRACKKGGEDGPHGRVCPAPCAWIAVGEAPLSAARSRTACTSLLAVAKKRSGGACVPRRVADTHTTRHSHQPQHGIHTIHRMVPTRVREGSDRVAVGRPNTSHHRRLL